MMMMMIDDFIVDAKSADLMCSVCCVVQILILFPAKSSIMGRSNDDDSELFPGYVDLLRRPTTDDPEKRNVFELKHSHQDATQVGREYFKTHFLHRFEDHLAAEERHRRLMVVNQPPMLAPKISAEEHRLISLSHEIMDLDVILL
jgi:hypothetical protein